jgi:hypothetical protein
LVPAALWLKPTLTCNARQNAASGHLQRLIDLSFDLSFCALVVASAVLTGGVIAAHVLRALDSSNKPKHHRR